MSDERMSSSSVRLRIRIRSFQELRGFIAVHGVHRIEWHMVGMRGENCIFLRYHGRLLILSVFRISKEGQRDLCDFYCI
jgi:hypothetical protein